MENTRRNYLDFVSEWMNKEENKGKSFTMGCALYDFCHWWNGTLSDLWIEDTVNEIICEQSGANYERVEGLNDDAKLEILDISILCELWQQIEDEEDEKEKSECFDELDGYSFVSRDEVIGAIENYFYPLDWKDSASYWELATYTEWADEYIEDRGLDFEE